LPPIVGADDCSGSFGVGFSMMVAIKSGAQCGRFAAARKAVVKATMLVTDVILRFRLAAINQSCRQPETWELQVMTIQEVAHVLVSLGFLNPEAGARLSEASTTITAQQDITTVRVEDFVPLIEHVYPEDEPASLEAQQTYVLIAQGETTEEALAAAGFVLRVDGPLQ
jgi:hypothetical protein